MLNIKFTSALWRVLELLPALQGCRADSVFIFSQLWDQHRPCSKAGEIPQRTQSYNSHMTERGLSCAKRPVLPCRDFPSWPVCLTLTIVKGRATATRWTRETSTWGLELPRPFQMPRQVLNRDWITSLARGRQGDNKQEQFRVRMWTASSSWKVEQKSLSHLSGALEMSEETHN